MYAGSTFRISCDLMSVFTLHVGISTYEITVEHRLRDHVVAVAGRLCFGPRFFGSSLPRRPSSFELLPSPLQSSSILMHSAAALLIRHP